MRLLKCRWKAAFCLGVVGILVGVSSCAGIVYKEPSDIETIPSKEWSREELLQSLAERIKQFRSLRSLASVHYQGIDGKGKFQEAIVVQRPDKLRLETLSSFGALLIVTANGERVSGFDPRQNVFFHGKSSKENLLRLTRIPLELREIAALLIGLPPVEIKGPWEEKQNALHRKLSGERSEVITFDSKLGVPTKWERSGADGEIELSALFSDFSATSAGPFPLKMVLEARTLERRLEIRYHDPEVNVNLSSSLFVQGKPKNAREIPLESLGG